MNPKKLSIESFWLPVIAPVIAKLSEHIYDNYCYTF